MAALPEAISCSGRSLVTTRTVALPRACRVVCSIKLSAVWDSRV